MIDPELNLYLKQFEVLVLT